MKLEETTVAVGACVSFGLLVPPVGWDEPRLFFGR